MTYVSDTGLLTLLKVNSASVFRSHTLALLMDLPKENLTPLPNRARDFHHKRLSTSLKRS